MNHVFPTFSIQSQPSAKANSTQVFFIAQNDKGAAIPPAGTLSEIQDLIQHKVFVGAPKTHFFIRHSYIQKENLAVVGVGSKSNFSTELARQSGALFYSKMMSEKISSVELNYDSLLKSFSKPQAESYLAAFTEGFLLASYTFNKHKTILPKDSHKIQSIVYLANARSLHKPLEAIAENVLNTVDCIFITRDSSNEPANIGTPTFYANEISKLAKTYGLKCKVLGKAEAKKEGMDLFLGVSKGSAEEPKCVILEYTPKTNVKKAKTIALVGKGVTFDSGGISLKPGMRMEDMKHDMTGAATMLGATLLAARTGCKNKIVTVMVFCENMPSGSAQAPSHVVKGRSGKTVEIINTDAEGRLVLADALDLAQDYKPDVMINAATLTGACSVALGQHASALFANNEKIAQKLLDLGNATDERLWQLPLWDEYFEDIKSVYADMMNSANNSNGGSIRGAIFLKQFIRPETKWAHLDIANCAYDLGFLPYNPKKGATGRFVRLLNQFAHQY